MLSTQKEMQSSSQEDPCETLLSTLGPYHLAPDAQLKSSRVGYCVLSPQLQERQLTDAGGKVLDVLSGCIEIRVFSMSGSHLMTYQLEAWSILLEHNVPTERPEGITS